MDTDTIEINNFLNQKRKSKRRSSIATCDAQKILSNNFFFFLNIFIKFCFLLDNQKE